MKTYKKLIKIKSCTIRYSDFFEFINEISKLSKDKKIEITVEFINEETIITDSIKEYKNELDKHDLSKLKKINFDSWKENLKISFEYRKSFFDDFELFIKSNKEETILKIEKIIKNYFYDNNYNFIVQDIKYLLISYIFFLSIVNFILIRDINLIQSTILNMIIWPVVCWLLPKYYPKLVIQKENTLSGRSLKKDLIWIIIIIFIPIFINLLTNK